MKKDKINKYYTLYIRFFNYFISIIIFLKTFFFSSSLIIIISSYLQVICPFFFSRLEILAGSAWYNNYYILSKIIFKYYLHYLCKKKSAIATNDFNFLIRHYQKFVLWVHESAILWKYKLLAHTVCQRKYNAKKYTCS